MCVPTIVSRGKLGAHHSGLDLLAFLSLSADWMSTMVLLHRLGAHHSALEQVACPLWFCGAGWVPTIELWCRLHAHPCSFRQAAWLRCSGAECVLTPQLWSRLGT